MDARASPVETIPMITNVWPSEFTAVRCKKCGKDIYGKIKRVHAEYCFDCWRELFPNEIDRYCSKETTEDKTLIRKLNRKYRPEPAGEVSY